ncbi:MAG: alcohol dehydrogenase catalytic domain-containing protein [Nitrososphaerota archaeon]|jgi:L-iditol 2-dehydrogenase|nr:alcohol dehydrogenase catalytic domain-containing protein [Nitrososphaerota archaeon]
MFAAVYYNNKDVRFEELPMPEIGEEEILLKVIASGICGSDVLEWYRLPKAPRVLGHEASGIVDQVGKKVVNVKVGDRVFISHHVPCNTCIHCQKGHHTACETLHNTNYYPGGFAQYIKIPKINVRLGTYKLPDNISYEEGTFIEPLACVARGQRLANLKKDDTVLIIGSGISGILHTQLAKFKGVKKIIAADINQHRMELSVQFGADYALNADDTLPQKIKAINEGHLADQVIVCTGAIPAVTLSSDCVERGGTILFFAVPDPTTKIPLPINQFWRNEITIQTSYGAAPNDLQEALTILATKKLNITDMITHRLPLRETQEGFQLMTKPNKSLKIILEPNNSNLEQSAFGAN